MSTHDCKRAETLVPGYLDGELSEAQAGPLRQHLLSCLACRGKAADLTNIKRWMDTAAPTGDIEIPQGFASRVAKAAFAEDHAPAVLTPQAPPQPVEQVRKSRAASESSILPFVLGLTSAAAALLLSISFLLGIQGQPTGSDLAAGELPDMLPEVLRELDELNAKEKKDRDSLEIEKERGTYKR